MHGLKKTLGFIGNAMVLVLILLLVSLVFLAISSKKSGDGIPRIGGYRLLVVLSGSMSPVFDAGDVIIVEPLAASGIRTGDIITFKDPGDQKRIVTHRVVEIVREPGLAFRTKGDANDAADRQLVPAGNVLGRMKFSVPYFGRMVEFAKTKKGLIWMIIVPGLLVILAELRHMAKILKTKDEGAVVKPWTRE